MYNKHKGSHNVFRSGKAWMEFGSAQQHAGLQCPPSHLLSEPIVMSCIACPFFARSYNDVKLAIRRAGLWTCYRQSIVHLNIAYGPWQSAAWFHTLISEAVSAAELMSESDPLLRRLWPYILQDQGIVELTDDVSGAEARHVLGIRALIRPRATSPS